MNIDWSAFLLVFAAALIAAVVVVGFYALGLRMLARSGRVPVVAPASFTDAITVLSPKRLAKAEKAAAKAAAKNPLSEGQKRLSLITAYACFVVCGLAVLAGILLIVLG
ncbi:peptidase [Microbacterium sp. JZ31]|uniref:peptidase n=1 Tax=Microbacterium sp. JZ31 TaxID=1906274 RepID=UPI001931B6F7|nr:peptidase [Microbacterium sp. JZ31]